MSSEIVRRPLVSRNKKAHLAYLEITDFKSYAGSHKLGPLKKGMNCIVGPNGSGKSNLMEAICWVLGVETRHLRGIRMADLAFRKEGEPRSITRRPEVKLTIHVEDTEGNKLEVKSFMRRVADNRFQFLIDEKLVDKDSYYKALAGYGILPKVQNCIVSQGQVESLSMKSEKEKGILFDEVSGSALLKPRYEQLKTKLREVDLELRKIHEKIKRKDTEKKSYEAQTKELQDFEAAEEAAKDMERQLYLFKLYVNSSISEEVTTRASEVETEIARLSREVEGERKKLETLNASRRELEIRVRNHKDSVQEQKASLKEAERQIELQEKRISLLKRTLDELTSQRDAKQAEVDSLYEKYKEIASHWLTAIETYEQQIAKIEQEKKENSFYKLTPSQKVEFEKRSRESHTQTSHLRSQIVSTSDSLKRLREELHQRQESRDESAEAEKTQQHELQQDLSQLHQLQSQVKTTEEALHKTGEQKNNLESSLHQLREQEQDLTVRRQEAASLLDTFASAKREDGRITRFKETVEKMKQRFPGVYGRLSHLCDLTNQTYATAVSVAMGLQADSVVCDTFRTAQMAIKFLKESRHPPVEFLPLDRLKVRDDQSRLNQYPSLFIPVINCISFDPKYKKAFAQVLEDVVVVDNLETARYLAYQKLRELKLSLKIVTVDGQKILKNCNIQVSGGGDRRSMNRFEEKKREESARIVAETESQLQSLTRQIRVLEDKLLQMSTEQDRLTYEKQDQQSKIQSLQKTIENRRLILKEWKPVMEQEQQIKQLATQIQTREAQLHDLKAQMQALESQSLSSSPELLAWNAAKKELDNLELRRAQIVTTHQSQVDECELGINELMRSLQLPTAGTSSLDAKMRLLEEELQTCTIVKNLDEEISLHNDKLKDYNVALNDLHVKCNEQKEAIRRLEKGDGTSEAQLIQVEKDLTNTKAKIREQELKVYELGMERATLSERLAEMDTQASDILNEIVSKSVKIPTKNGTFEDLTRTWGAKAVSEMDDGSGVDIDFSQVPDDWARFLTPDEAKRKENEMVAAIQEKRSHLNSIHPNFKAREHLEEAKEAFAKLKKTHKELSLERQKVDDEFSKCRECRCEKFRRCFEKTKAALESIYSDLTRGTEDYSATEVDPSVAEIWKKHFSNVPGGVARLELIEEPKTEIFESGVSFYAMPPGKRFTEMDALSGGEKSMATLALLFALQSHRPSPFVVLDEVDAALDVTNVQSLRNWLKKAPFQVVIVTLKDEMYCHADAIIGVYKDHENESSGTLTLDVEAYA